MTIKVIKDVTIEPSTSPLGNTRARVLLEDQTDGSVSEGHLFVWNKSEIHFDKAELIGLTVLEAHELRHKKNRQCRLEQEAQRRKEHHRLRST